ncbi:hypothetical protein ACEOHC_003909 [Salmonella enterica]
MKKLITLAAVISLAFASFNASAISAKYRAQLERSGCNEINAGHECDIHKTKAQNEAAAKKAATNVAPWAGKYAAFKENGQRVANITITRSNVVTINGKKGAKVHVSDEALYLMPTEQTTYTFFPLRRVDGKYAGNWAGSEGMGKIEKQ